MHEFVKNLCFPETIMNKLNFQKNNILFLKMKKLTAAQTKEIVTVDNYQLSITKHNRQLKRPVHVPSHG